MDYNEFFKTCIYNQYVTCIEKFGDTTFAYNQTAYAIKYLLKYNDFKAFTRSNDIRNTLQTNFTNPIDYYDAIINQFLHAFFNTSPKNEQELALYDAILVTKGNYGDQYIVEALFRVLSGYSEAYRCFSRHPKNSNVKTINYRKRLMDLCTIDDISNIIIDTVTKSIINEKSLEQIFFLQKTGK